MEGLSSSMFCIYPQIKGFLPTPTITRISPSVHIVSSLRIHEQTPCRDHMGSAKLLPINTKTRNPSSQPPFLARFFHSLDVMIDNFLDPPHRLSVDPHYVLSDNFVPVHELPPTECAVVYGSLPPSLDGAYIRTGPNPQFLPHGPYHFLDGDGMLHAVRISKGRATLCSRYVETYKYEVERKNGCQVVPNMFGAMHGPAPTIARAIVFLARVLAGHYNPANGVGTANTSLALLGGILYALCESDLPYAVKVAPDGDVITLGRQTFDNKLSMNMAAHPKIDPGTQEAFAFRYCSVRPFLTYFRFDSHGNKQQDVPIFSMKHASIVHDMGITKNYAVFCESQIGVNPMRMIRGGTLVGVDSGKVPRIGIIPRNAVDESEMSWFDVPGFNNLHVVNAWEEVAEGGGDAVVFVAPNIHSVEHFFDRMHLAHISMEKVKIELRTGKVSRQTLSARSMDFAVINPAYVARKCMYVYAAVGELRPKTSRMVRVVGIVKLDIGMSEAENRDCIVATRMYDSGCFGGEPFFVAKDPDNQEAKEDEGYIISFVHNENTDESSFLVMDAQSPSLEIVAIVKLPQRVPYGLHGLFVKETELEKL